MEDLTRMRELKQQGFFCSQIIMIMGMELQGKTDPDLVKAMHGLSGGLGFSGELCGALSGGACLLGVYAGRGEVDDEEDPRLMFMIQDLVGWFKETFGEKYGGIRCEQILAANGGNQMMVCPMLVSQTFQKVKELLVENGYDLAGF